MPDPFKTKKSQPDHAPGTARPFTLRETALERRDAPPAQRRSRQTIRAVKLLDLLTTGDDGLRAYLAEEARRLPDPGGAPDRPDGVDALLSQPIPPVGTVDFEALKRQLLTECQQSIADAMKEAFGTPIELLTLCGLPHHRIHSIDLNGNILRHYTADMLDSRALREADRVLYGEPDAAYVETHNNHLVLVFGNGSTQVIPLQ